MSYFSEAVRRFCGDSLYALRRAKDAANVLGLREKNELTKEKTCIFPMHVSCFFYAIFQVQTIVG